MIYSIAHKIDNLLSENSVVVSLNAKFGMGKSYFLEMFDNYLRDDKKTETIFIFAEKISTQRIIVWL